MDVLIGKLCILSWVDDGDFYDKFSLLLLFNEKDYVKMNMKSYVWL